MGEVVVSSEDATNLPVKEAEENTKEEDETTSSMVRWERFLPKMALRVLLVEADDSTRQIIAALLRKCSYRVAAVPDGLKAWEVLKGKPRNIDLILTEVDLPSISGFALLTLIMEHDICKNIPVIMMSSNDSVNVVYKCMLRGAADFLVKPVRKNELRNLWQHVWRRQVSTRGANGLQDESVAQHKVEATAENNAASNHSSGYMACVQRNRECIEKGSDAQSSCTKPDLETEGEYAEDTQDLSQPDQSKSPAGDMQMQKHENHVKSSRNLLMHDCEDTGVPVAASKDANEVNEKDVASENQTYHGNITKEAFDGKLVFVSSSREAIDLIGTFDNYPKCTYIASGSNCPNKNDSSPILDLSLKRSTPSGSVNQFSDERHTLNHSDASAFSRYINRAVQPRNSAAGICDQQKDSGTTSGRLLSNHILDYNSNTHGSPLNSQRNILSTAIGQSGQAEVAFPCSQQTVLSVPIPVRTIRFDNPSTAYRTVVPPMFCTQSGPSTLQSPGSSHHQEPSFNAYHPSSLERTDSQQACNPIDQNPNNSISKTEDKQGHKFESSEDQRRVSSATDQSATSSFCNGNASNGNTMGSQSNGNADEVVVVQTVAESGNECLPIHGRTSHRSVQREAALTKFRLKRKERCYEKKVRYESRKKLAEQRPRVKGQFVRQVQSDPAPPEMDSPYGYSIDG